MTKSKKKVKKPELLITKYKSEIIKKVQDHKVVIIVGQTGCGKSTQVPQYLYNNRAEIGLVGESIIACLHPRSVAAISLAERVSYEMGRIVGDLAGYRVRFYTLCERSARIVFMTAGFMSRLLSTEKVIEEYGVVIVDEAHERSLQIDVVLGQLKELMTRYIAIRLVIMSATLNVADITEYFPNAAVVRVAPTEDRVDIIYRSINGGDYVNTIVGVVREILKTTSKGHVLVFLPSEDKVWRCKKLLRFNGATVLAFYGAMDHDDKMAVFEEYGESRKVIVATNIAETSLTIVGVRFIVDSGFVKRVHYDHKTHVERWRTDTVSAAEADQRKGRTGRTGSGRCTCYRLYDRYDYHKELSVTLGPLVGDLEKLYSLADLRIVYDNLETITDVSSLDAVRATVDKILETISPKKGWVTLWYPVPEIKYASLESTVLTMKTNNINIETFPFIVAPKEEDVKDAVAHLKELSLFNDDASLTPLGVRVSRMPLTPSLGKVAVLASDLECREDVFIIIAMLSVANLLKNPSRNAAGVHGHFDSPHGDLIRLLRVYEEAEMYRFDRAWCKMSGITHSSLKFAKLVVAQLSSILPSRFGNRSSRELFSLDVRLRMTKVIFLSGFFQNLCVHRGKGYEMPDETACSIYQYSCVDKSSKLVMSISVRSSMSDKSIVLKDCMVYDEKMLVGINPREWRIRANLWGDVLASVVKKK